MISERYIYLFNYIRSDVLLSHILCDIIYIYTKFSYITDSHHKLNIHIYSNELQIAHGFKIIILENYKFQNDRKITGLLQKISE